MVSKKNEKTKNAKKAFTIVELIITIAIVAVLAGIAVTTLSGVREDARDNTRYGNAVTISEALEKYYEQNGGYPSVASISNDNTGNTGAAVATKLSIPVDSLVMPQMPGSSTNAITSGPEPHDDYIAYIAQSAEDNESCQNDVNGGCDQFTLRYLEESGETKVIESRRTLRVVIEKPDLTVTASSPSTINASWTSISGATSYTLQRSQSSDMSSATSSNHGSTSSPITGLSASVTYYFRVQANLPSGTSDWSDIESATTNGITAPTGTLTILASMSGSNAIGTAGGGSCAAGTTVERQIRYNSTSTSTAGGWSSYAGGSPRSVAASEGWRYTFQQQARCTGPGGQSGWVSSGTAATFRPITTIPAAPVISVSDNSTNSRWTWNATACPAGASAQYRSNRIIDNGLPATGWSGAINSSSSPSYTWYDNRQGFQYTNQIQVRCYTTHSTGGWSTTGSRSFIRPVAAPQPATNFQWTPPNPAYPNFWQITWDTAVCGPGTIPWAYTFAYNAAGNWFGGYVARGMDSDWINFTGPAGSPYAVEISHRCLNSTTDRESPTGPLAKSPIYTP